MKIPVCLFLLIALVLGGAWSPANAQVGVLTYHNDNQRTGANTNETILNLTNVNSTAFGKLFTYAVDGYVYAQPLYVPRVAVAGLGTHDVLLVATEHNTVYAFDADTAGAGGGLLWKTNLGPSAVTTIANVFTNRNFGTRYNNNAYTDIVPEVGITGTPVIDANSGTLYVDVFTGELSGGVTNYFHRLHALNITNGIEQPNSPVVVTASVAGSGVDSVAGKVTFNAKQESERVALTLAGGILYLTFTSYADTNPYHGWILGYNPTSLVQLTNYIFNTTPNSTTATYGSNAGEGGIWMGGCGLAVDANTNLYFLVGNGIFNVTNNSGRTEYGDSIMKLSTTNGLSVADYFTPYDQFTLAANDTDLGSGGLVLLPDQPGSFPHVLMGAGKAGKIYALNRDQLTTGNNHFSASGTSDSVLQSTTGRIGGSFGTPAYFNGRIYYAANGDNLKALSVTNGLLSSTTLTNSARTFGFPGATASVSANGTNNGIVWAIQKASPAVLVACNATNFTTELYTSSQAAGNRDLLGNGVKFAVPTVADGKVYVGTISSVSAFGLLAGTVAFSSPAYSVTKGGGTATITVNRIGGTSGAVSVVFASVPGGTAASGVDYLDASGTLNWANGDGAAKTFTVTILNNSQPTTNLTVNLTLQTPTGGVALDAPATTTLTILSPPATFTLAASSITTNSATLNGSVFPNGSPTKAWFQWGTTTGYDNATVTNSLGNGTDAIIFNSPLSNLQPGTLYYFAVSATNDYGVATSSSASFVTQDVPRTISGIGVAAPGQFALQFSGNSNVNYAVLVNTNLAAPLSNWTVLGPATWLSNSLFQFTDTQATNDPQRYYRLRSP